VNQVGTVRREDHDGGYSIWVLVHRALCQGFGSTQQVWRNPEWLCIESTAVGNCGQSLSSEEEFGRTIGVVPGTEAAEQRDVDREVREDRTRDAAGLE
jgi:hypothetical protein